MEEYPYRAKAAVERICQRYSGNLLDLGCGDGKHAEVFRANGFNVTTVDLNPECEPDHVMGIEMYLAATTKKYDVIWMSHVLEHQMYHMGILEDLFRVLAPGGVAAITVPPMKPEIVGGHLTLWNAGLLLYNLVVAGYDMSNASVKTYGYNITVISDLPVRPGVELNYDKGDIELLADYFPIPVHQGFNGNIEEINW